MIILGEMNGFRVRTVSTSLGEWISSGNEWSQSPCHPVSGSTCPGLAIGAWCGKSTAPGCAWCLRGHASAWFSPFWRGPAPGAQRYQATRICWASQETFITGFESKYGMRHITPKEEIPHGKRKYSDPAGQVSAKPFDGTGTYSVRDMQALTATFANPVH